MKSLRKPLLELAAAIHARIAVVDRRAPTNGLPTHAWERCQCLVRRIGRANARGWRLAAQLLRGELRDAVAEICACLPRSSTWRHTPPRV
jgi:hypothetical protein